MKYIVGFGLFFLAIAILVFGWIFYNSSQKAALAVNNAATGTQNLNQLAGKIDNALTTFGIQG